MGLVLFESENGIIVYDAKASGGADIVQNCKYDRETKKTYLVTGQLSKFAVGYENISFIDVNNDAWYANAVEFVTARRLFSGVGNSMFDPQGSMTRAMFATVLANLEGADLSQYKTSSFMDVNINEWYGKAITWAADKQILSGIGDEKFDPNANITREQMAVMLNNYIKYKDISLKITISDSFADVEDISSWALDSVDAMRGCGIIRGAGNNMYNPRNTATRAEVSSIFANLIKMYVK